MRTVLVFVFLFALLLAAGAAGCKSPGLEPVTSPFTSGDEGWKIVGDAQSGSAKPAHKPDNGKPGPFILAKDDAAGGVWYWQAPAKFLGAKESSYGKTFSFCLNQSAVDSQFDADDVLFVGGKTTLVFDLPKNPGKEWTRYSVPLKAGAGWKVGTRKGNDATEAQMRAVLKDLKRIRIRGEYRTGGDTGGLDTVVLER